MSRRRSREDRLQEAIDSDARWWQSFGRVVTHHPVTVHGQTYIVEETSFVRPPYHAELERLERLTRTYLADRPESSRSRKRARVPAAGEAILGLREASGADAGLPAECAVCLQDFVAEDRLRVMPCSHAFHQDCIFQWLRVNRVCPLCRHALPTQQLEDEDEDDLPTQEDEDEEEGFDALPTQQLEDEDEDDLPTQQQDDDDED